MTAIISYLRTRVLGIFLIALTYFYFLIFAQFGFLHRVTEDLGAQHWNLVLGLMGGAGLFGALWTGFKFKASDGRHWLTVAFAGTGLGALCAIVGHSIWMLALAAAVSGFSLAVLTVALVGVLQQQFPVHGIGLLCGWGTGLAYFLSNLPAVFEASAALQCSFALYASILGAVMAWSLPQAAALSRKPRRGQTLGAAGRVELLGVVLVFLVLIATDSAAFTQIQQSAELKAASWSGAGQLWSIAAVHLIAAALGGWLMDLGAFRSLSVFTLAGLMLGFLLLQAERLGLAPALLYAAAVSLYSTALVAFALVRGRGRSSVFCAGLVFGISGWIGSGLGIGMVNDLGGVPLVFWPIVGCLLALGLLLVSRRGVACR